MMDDSLIIDTEAPETFTDDEMPPRDLFQFLNSLTSYRRTNIVGLMMAALLMKLGNFGGMYLQYQAPVVVTNDMPPPSLVQKRRPQSRALRTATLKQDFKPLTLKRAYAPPSQAKLDFFIAGFPKCGTTSLLYAFSAHNETAIGRQEHCSLANTGVSDSVAYARLADELNDLAPMHRDSIKRGIKCPRGLQSSRMLERLEYVSPEAKLIVGLRHPVDFFQSYYNYRITEIHDKAWNDEIPPIETLFRDEEWKGVSTDNARFEVFLMQLGKANMTMSDFQKLQGRPHMSVKPNAFKIFLYSLNQLEDTNVSRTATFREGLEQFLELEHHLKPLGHENINHFVGDKAHTETVNICERKYRPIRKILVEQAQETHRWIRDEFLKSPDVIVANEEHFLQSLQGWDVDPCPEMHVAKPTRNAQVAQTT